MRPSFISINIGGRKLIVTRPITHLEDYCTQSDMISYMIITPGSLNAELREITEGLSFIVCSEATTAVSSIRCLVMASNAIAFEERLNRLRDDYGPPIMLTMGHLRVVVFIGDLPDTVTDSLELSNDHFYMIAWSTIPDRVLLDQIYQDGRISPDSIENTPYMLVCRVGRDYGASFEETLERGLQECLKRMGTVLAS